MPAHRRTTKRHPNLSQAGGSCAPGLCARVLGGRLSVFPPPLAGPQWPGHSAPASLRSLRRPNHCRCGMPRTGPGWQHARSMWQCEDAWWRRTRTGNGSMSPSCEGDVGRAAAQQRRAETQWFAVHDGMSSGPWDNHSNSQWSTVSYHRPARRSLRLTTYVDSIERPEAAMGSMGGFLGAYQEQIQRRDVLMWLRELN